MILKTLYLKTFFEKKDLLLLANKLVEEIPEEKQKNSKTIRNNYLSTKKF